MDLLYLGLRFRGQKDFLFFFVFAKLFEYFDESALKATAGIQKYFLEDSKTNGKIRQIYGPAINDMNDLKLLSL
jgi:hypothetical protein